MILLIWFTICIGYHFRSDVISHEEIINGAELTVKNGMIKKSYRLRAKV
jgi:hypothetical protein